MNFDMRSLRPALSGAALLLTVVTLAVCSDATATGIDPDEDAAARAGLVQCASGNGDITLPAGFCAAVVADQVGPARHIAVAANGDIYVAIDDANRAEGILALRDANRDGPAEVKNYFGAPRANGIALRGDHLYVAYRDRIERYRLQGNQLVPQSSPEVVVSGLPGTGDHARKNIQFDGAGSMYVNIASASNSCQVANRQIESPGVDPCPEFPIRAGIWRFDADELGQTQADGERFATGLRNIEALRFDKVRNALFGLQHGRDHLNDNFPSLFTVQQGADLPSEEFLRIDRGDDAGWPYCYHDWQKNLKVLAPEYGGDGTIVGRCAGLEAPIMTFPGHWAPNDLLFYRGSQFPTKYRGSAFIAFHGGHDRDNPLPNEGYNVTFVPFGGVGPTGSSEVFADGFTGGGSPLPAAAVHRPMGLAEGPDGSLYITDDRGGRIWRVVFNR